MTSDLNSWHTFI